MKKRLSRIWSDKLDEEKGKILEKLWKEKEKRIRLKREITRLDCRIIKKRIKLRVIEM